MSYFQTPEFPVLAWKHTIESDITVAVEYNSVSYNGTLAAGDYWGFTTNTTNTASSDSLLGVLASTIEDVLNDPAKHNLSVALSGSHSWTGGSENSLIGSISVEAGSIAASNVEVNLSSNASDFGSDGVGNDLTISNISLNGSTDFSLAGYWAPYDKAVRDDRDYQDSAYSVLNITGNSTSIVKWGDQRIRRVLTFPIVYAAYIFDYRASDSGFADPAERNVLDPNNLLQNFKTAVAGTSSDFTIRVFEDHGKYRSGRVVDTKALTSLESYISDISARGAMFEVTIPMVDLGDSGVVGGAT